MRKREPSKPAPETRREGGKKARGGKKKNRNIQPGARATEGKREKGRDGGRRGRGGRGGRKEGGGERGREGYRENESFCLEELKLP